MRFGAVIVGSLAWAIVVLGAGHARGQTYGSFTAYQEEGAIVLSGMIEPDSPNDFRKALDAAGGPHTIVLRSGGGTVAAALEIAAVISDRNLMTLVGEGDVCASACSILYFAGRQRVALGELGVHQMSSSGRGSLTGLQFILADVLSAFDMYDVDDRVMQKMLRTPATDMHFFTHEEKTEWGIDRYSKAEPQPPRVSFSRYPPDGFHGGQVVLPDFDGRDQWARMYRTRIRNGIAEGANFAGHYAVIEIGCGTSCRFAYLADVSTGEVFNFPYGGEEQYQLGLIYAPDSRLLRATWKSPSWNDESDRLDTCVSQDMLWDGGEFEVVHEETFPIRDGGFCSLP